MAAGKALARDRGCTSCHSSSGAKGTGPTWKGLYGSEVKLSDGTTVTADETYIKESITDPSAKIVDGYGNLMPHFNLSQTEVKIRSSPTSSRSPSGAPAHGAKRISHISQKIAHSTKPEMSTLRTVS